MQFLKRVAFSIPFLICFYLIFFKAAPFIKDIYLIFSLDFGVLAEMIILAGLVLLTALFFCIFTVLANDWRIVLGISFLAILAPIIMFNPPFSFMIAVLSFLIFTAYFFSINKKMAKYLTFEPSHLLSPSIKSLGALLIVSLAVYFYLQANLEIQTNGFQVPDSILNTALKLANPTSAVQGIEFKKGDPRPIAQLPGVSQAQLDYLKQHPELLKQYGVDPSALNSVTVNPTSSSNPQDLLQSTTHSSDQLKPLIKNQINQFIKPFEKFIPILLAILFFFTIQSLMALEGLFLSPLISLIFWILEKTGYIHFEKEMREVKKLVV